MATKRYLVDKKALEIFNIKSEDAVDVMASNRIIKGEALAFKNLPFATVRLTDQQRDQLKEAGYFVNEDNYIEVRTEGADYEKIRSRWVKPVARLETGKNVKVAVIDSGCAVAHVPVDFPYNFIDNNTTINDGVGHGTKTTSVIRSSIGLAPDCIIHHLKVISDIGQSPGSSILAAFDYCITNDIDIINMSFQVDLLGLAEVIAECVAADIVLAGAAGNSSIHTQTSFPAAFPNVVAVNAVRENGHPIYRNSLPPQGGHGITVACSGAACELINKNGALVAENGTSYAAPFFVGAFALYKERTKLANNYEVLEYMLSRVKKTNNSHFGLGLITF